MCCQGSDQFRGHELGMSGLFEGEVEVVLELFRGKGRQVKAGADATAQGKQLWGSEPIGQSSVTAEDGKEQAF